MERIRDLNTHYQLQQFYRCIKTLKTIHKIEILLSEQKTINIIIWVQELCNKNALTQFLHLIIDRTTKPHPREIENGSLKSTTCIPNAFELFAQQQVII